jgi:hypothetical protein
LKATYPKTSTIYNNTIITPFEVFLKAYYFFKGSKLIIVFTQRYDTFDVVGCGFDTVVYRGHLYPL